MNPVLRRELVERWRGRRATAILTVYLAVLGGIMYLLYRIGLVILREQMRWQPVDLSFAGPTLGRFLFEGLLFFILLLVLFVTPGYAAAQISGERERRTLPLLQITMLAPVQIAVGKLGASLAWLALLVVAALPLGAASFFLGGVALGDLLRSTLFIMIVATSIAGIGLGISAVVKRTTASVVLTYAVVLALTFGSLFLALAEGILRAQRTGMVSTPVTLYANPFLGLADAADASAADSVTTGAGLPSPLGLLAEALPDSQTMRQAQAAMTDDGVLLEQPAEGDEQPVWLGVSALYVLLGGAGLLVATRRVRVVKPPVRQRSGVPTVTEPAG